MGLATPAGHAALFAGRGQDQRQTSAAQRGPDEEFFVAGRPHGRAFARILCDVLDAQQPKGPYEVKPSQSWPWSGREHGYKPLSDTPSKRRHATARRQRGQPQSGGHPQYGEAAHVGAGKSFIWERSAAPCRGSPSRAEGLRFEQDSVPRGDPGTGAASASSKYRKAHEGVTGIRQRDFGDSRRCPVGGHWTIVTPVRTGDLTAMQRYRARAHHDVPIP